MKTSNQPRYAMEFDTEDALKKYLKDHPGADKSNHSVKKPSKDSPAEEGEDKHQVLKKRQKADHAAVKGTSSAFFDVFQGLPNEVQAKNPEILDIMMKTQDTLADEMIAPVKDPDKAGEDWDITVKHLKKLQNAAFSQAKKIPGFIEGAKKVLKEHEKRVEDNKGKTDNRSQMTVRDAQRNIEGLKVILGDDAKSGKTGSLHAQLVRLAHEIPETRKHLLPILRSKS